MSAEPKFIASVYPALSPDPETASMLGDDTPFAFFDETKHDAAVAAVLGAVDMWDADPPFGETIQVYVFPAHLPEYEEFRSLLVEDAMRKVILETQNAFGEEYDTYLQVPDHLGQLAARGAAAALWAALRDQLVIPKPGALGETWEVTINKGPTGGYRLDNVKCAKKKVKLAHWELDQPWDKESTLR